MTLLIRNCIIVKKHKPIKTSVLMQDSTIIAIGKDLQGDKTYDAKGKLLLPGCIDTFVRFREPHHTQKESWESGTKAAISSGITTVLDVPHTDCVTIEQLLRKKRHIVESYANYGFHLHGVQKNKNLLGKMRDIASVYIDMSLPLTDTTLLQASTQSKQRILLHTEDHTVLQLFAQQQAYPKNPLRFHNKIRPNICAQIGLAKAIAFCKMHSGMCIASHVSTKEEVDLLRMAKHQGVRVYAQVAPHHLFLTEDHGPETLGKVHPPLRKKEDCKALWKGIHEGVIHMISSHHEPHTWNEKQSPYDQVPAGIGGIEVMLPLLLDAVHRKLLTITDVQRLTATNPARIFGLEKKGEIAVGFDGDLVLIDMEEERSITSLDFHSQAKFSPFDGRRCKGWPVAAFVRGRLAYERRGTEQTFHTPNGSEVLYKRK